MNQSDPGDGSVDTLRDGIQTSILINDRTQTWGAGYAQTSADRDHIGIYIGSWNDTDIVINGFGSMLGNRSSPSQYTLSSGDLITITIYGPNQIGITSYEMVVV